MTAAPPTETHAAASNEPPLSPEEFAALDREDVQAGKLIGRLLAFFFFYTIVVTVLAAWWTWDAIR